MDAQVKTVSQYQAWIQKRNGEIFAAWFQGFMQTRIADIFHMTTGRVSQIITGELRYSRGRGAVVFDQDVGR